MVASRKTNVGGLLCDSEHRVDWILAPAGVGFEVKPPGVVASLAGENELAPTKGFRWNVFCRQLAALDSGAWEQLDPVPLAGGVRLCALWAHVMRCSVGPKRRQGIGN